MTQSPLFGEAAPRAAYDSAVPWHFATDPKPYQPDERLTSVFDLNAGVVLGAKAEYSMLVSTTINRARDFAIAKHSGQVRKHDGRPYIVHLDGVASVLDEYGHRSDGILAAAFLHDTIEKTDTSIEELNETFGERIAELVYWLTDSEKGSRKSRAMQSAWRLSRAPWDAKLIKLADIIDNGMAIVSHNPAFGPTFLDEKRLCLKKMAEVETSRLLRLPLFQKAATVTESASL